MSNCWNFNDLSTEAARIVVVVSVEMTRDAKPIHGTVKLVDVSEGSSDAAQKAFDAARRAILRCGLSGYDLPQEKYDQWKQIEMTFNPERMRLR